MIVTIVLAGGIGKRLWPLSTEEIPKQFIRLLDGKSLFQHSIDNALIISKGPLIVIANNKHYDLVLSQIKTYSADNIHVIFEHNSYNTAVAISVACLYINDRFSNSSVLILPSDHHIENIASISQEIAQLNYLNIKHINIFGITPDRLDNNYGFISKGNRTFYKSNLCQVDNFIEKPEIQLAEKFYSSSQYLWNIGIIFALNKSILREIKKYNYSLIEFSKQLINNKNLISKNIFLLKDANLDSKINISIDYLLLEKAKDIYVSHLKLKWSDLGSWVTLIEFIKKHITNYLRCKKPKIVLKPWGHYQTFVNEDNFRIKILKINSFQRISLQSHKYRNETWVILEGIANLTLDNEYNIIKKDSIIHIPKNTKHRIENIDSKNLIILELQTGKILCEDDIIRWEDDYIRETSKIVA